MTSAVHIAMPATLVLLLGPGLAAAQEAAPAGTEDECTYDACALRLDHRFLRAPRILQGVEGRVVGGASAFSGRLDLFAERSDTAAVLYDGFRRAQRWSTVLGTVGGLLGLAGAIAAADDGEFEAGPAAAILIGFGLRIGGDVVGVRARDRLSGAIWWYNRTLPGRPEEEAAREGLLQHE